MEKLNEFIKKVDGQPIMGAMKEPEHGFSSAEEVFEKIVKHEQYITSLIKKLVEKAMDDKDYITLKFLDWFVNEQLEEENLFNDIMDKIKILGDLKGRNLYEFDKFMDNLDKEEHNKN
ncbi:ferritin Dps family protein [Brachyspira sp. CAG:700]|nr:ferritin Dps family protein [Brachyspira sp. CAG:700]